MSLILDGTSGITTPGISSSAAGSFTTVSASGQTTLTGGVNLTSVAGTSYIEGTWTPVVTSGTGTITTVGAVSGAYTRIGRVIVARYDVVITTNGTGATYLNIAGLPTAASGKSAGVGHELNSTGSITEIRLGDTATAMQVYYYNATYPGGDGTRNIGTIVYNV